MKTESPLIKAHMIIEIMGTPENHVNETLALIGEKFGKDVDEIKVQDIKVREAQKVKVEGGDNFYSGFLEIDAHFEHLYALVGAVFDWMPSSVEIYEPDLIAVKSTDANNIVNDLIGRLHQLDANLKTDKARISILTRELKKYKEVKPDKA